MMSKRQALLESVKTFNKSPKGPEDIYHLIIAANSALRPADGLAWSEIKSTIEEAFKEK